MTARLFRRELRLRPMPWHAERVAVDQRDRSCFLTSCKSPVSGGAGVEPYLFSSGVLVIHVCERFILVMLEYQRSLRAVDELVIRDDLNPI